MLINGAPGSPESHNAHYSQINMVNFYDGAEGSFIWNFPLSCHMKLPVKFHLNWLWEIWVSLQLRRSFSMPAHTQHVGRENEVWVTLVCSNSSDVSTISIVHPFLIDAILILSNCLVAHSIILCYMMTSSNGNIFRVTGHFCGESPVISEFPTKKPVTRSFDVFFDLRLYKRLSKQS